MKYKTIIAVLICGKLAAQEKPVLKKINGFVVGEDVIAKPLKQYGMGFLNKDEGHGGGIYYCNVSKTKTLWFEIGTDSLIESAGIKSGCTYGMYDSTRIGHSAVNKLIPARDSLDYGVNLGDSVDKINKIFGPSYEKSKDGDLIVESYRYDYTTNKNVRLGYILTMKFKKERLIEIYVHDGD